MRLFAIRHGETAWTRERRFSGARDIPLTERGQRQAEAVAQALAGQRIAAVYTSPLVRARVCAEIIARPHGLSVSMEPAFREMAFGEWEGLTRHDLETGAAPMMETWRTAPERARPPGGERLTEVAARVGKALQQVRDSHPEGAVVLVSHAIVLRLLVLDALGLGPERLWSLDASPAGLTEIEYQPGWATVHRMNTLAHLRALDT
ncbi:MAG: histidine phosphatase family protein [Candidatus Rokuibacteriota bacterium]